jgi:galactose-1-phosphate uridylyltransferase
MTKYVDTALIFSVGLIVGMGLSLFQAVKQMEIRDVQTRGLKQEIQQRKDCLKASPFNEWKKNTKKKNQRFASFPNY